MKKTIYENNPLVSKFEEPFFKAVWESSARYTTKYMDKLYNTQDVINHYTDMNGLYGILNNKCFWLTNILYLNDSKEIFNGRDISINLINILLNNILLNKKRYACFKNVLNITIDYLNSNEFKNIYITSFSLENDSLEQWRAYSKNGSGVSISFNTRTKSTYPHFGLGNFMSLVKVIYDDKLKNKILFSIIFKYFYEYKKDNDKIFSDNDYVEHLAQALTRVFVHFKHSSFQSEKEVRLVCAAQNDFERFNNKEYRVVNNVIVPYLSSNNTKLKDSNGIKLKVDLIPVDKITIGPKNNQDIVLNGIKDFVNEIGYKNIKIEKSKIPYRG